MSEQAPNQSCGTEAAGRFQCDLYCYWRAAHELRALRLGVRRFLTRSALRQLRVRLDPTMVPDSDLATAPELSDLHLYFIRRTLERLSLLRRDPERGLVPGLRAEVARFFALPFDERIRLLVKLWLAGGWWVERLDERHEPPGLRAPAPPSAAVGRRRALQVLLDAAPGAVLTLGSAEGGQTGSTGLRVAQHHSTDTGVSALFGPLCWMGLVVETTETPTAGIVPALRATRALDALRQTHESEPAAVLAEPTGPVVIGADYDVLAYPPFAAPTLLTLDTCCEQTGSGVVARFRLSRAGFVRARRSGWGAGETQQRLTALSGGALPQNVRVTLQDWDRQADRVRLRTDVAVLDVRTPHLLEALAADVALGAAVVRRLTSTRALIADGQADAVRQWLLRRGGFPAIVARADE